VISPKIEQCVESAILSRRLQKQLMHNLEKQFYELKSCTERSAGIKMKLAPPSHSGVVQSFIGRLYQSLSDVSFDEDIGEQMDELIVRACDFLEEKSGEKAPDRPTGIERFDLSAIGAENVMLMMDQVANMPAVRCLSLCWNHLTDEHVYSIAHMLSALPQLGSCTLSNNLLYEPYDLLAMCVRHKTIKHLILKHNSLSSDFVAYVHAQGLENLCIMS
jgi:hypothetical protein